MSKFAMLDLCFTLMDETGESFSTDAMFFVDGVIVSGTIIHPVAYIKGLAETMKSSDDPDSTAELIGKMMTEAIEKKLNQPLDQPHEEIDEIERAEIYLMNVKIWNPPGTLNINNTFLALRIDSIDGFMWGECNP